MSSALPEPADGLRTARETANYLGLSTRTLDRWRAAGQGPPFIRIGASVRYPAQDLDAWLAGRGGVGSGPSAREFTRNRGSLAALWVTLGEVDGRSEGFQRRRLDELADRHGEDALVEVVLGACDLLAGVLSIHARLRDITTAELVRRMIEHAEHGEGEI